MQIGVEVSRAVENKRVFVVHGDEILRAALQFMLHDENEAHELATLQEAYDKADGRKVDLLLLEHAVLRERGALVLKEIAQRLPGAKILLVAPPSENELAKTWLTQGASAILNTPLKLETVRQKVDTLLGRIQPALVSLAVLS